MARVKSVNGRRQLNGRVPVTPREAEVLHGVVRGESNAEISRRLRIREQTVKNHVSVLLRKLKARNRVQLAVMVATGQLTPELNRLFGGTRH
jgi:DNA-binding NarL/FixJ family response regulator